MTTAVPRVSAGWLALREAADAAARARDLVDLVAPRVSGDDGIVIHDLGSGTGAMGRWLAPRLPGPQRWVMHDRDGDLLQHARADMTLAAADGAAVFMESRRGDLTRLTAQDFAGAGLITASALLDMLTNSEVDRVVAAITGAGCPALLTITVIGRVEFTPPDPLDAEIADAFNAHQRRTTSGRSLLGPDAVEAAVEAFARRGVGVQVRPSPWRLGAVDAGLLSEWFTGWVWAACEQRPELTEVARPYARRRLADAAAGRLRVVVHHHDLLAGHD